MIRVLIERRLAEGLEQHYEQAVRLALAETVTQPGFISGESLRDLDHPHRHVLLCSWRSRMDWEKWAASGERRELMARMRPMLECDEQVTILSPV